MSREYRATTGSGPETASQVATITLHNVPEAEIVNEENDGEATVSWSYHVRLYGYDDAYEDACPGGWYQARGQGTTSVLFQVRNPRLDNEGSSEPFKVGKVLNDYMRVTLNGRCDTGQQRSFDDPFLLRMGQGPDGRELWLPTNASNRWSGTFDRTFTYPGGNGTDRFWGTYDLRRTLVTACGTLVSGTNDDDRLFGTTVPELLRGLGGRDDIRGGGGDDCLEGGAGDDFLDGKVGADQLEGGLGSDYLTGGAGRDDLVGGGESDHLSDGLGVNGFAGGPGNDLVSSRQSIGERIACGPGVDIAILDKKDRATGCETQVRGPYWIPDRTRSARGTRPSSAHGGARADGFTALGPFVYRDAGIAAGIAAGHLVGSFELRLPQKCAKELIAKLKRTKAGIYGIVIAGKVLGIGSAALKAKLFASGANLSGLSGYFRRLAPKILSAGRGVLGLLVSYFAKKGTDALIGGASSSCKIARENLDAFLLTAKAAKALNRQPGKWSLVALTTFVQKAILTCRWDQQLVLGRRGTSVRMKDHYHVDFRGICPD